MDASTILSRLQFAFTASYHYLFPQLTMGLALLLLILKTLYLRSKDERYNDAVHFWGRIFAITFVVGVVSGIPLEFQFGTNWARFSAFAGDIIAQTLAMEGAFAFFLESAIRSSMVVCILPTTGQSSSIPGSLRSICIS